MKKQLYFFIGTNAELIKLAPIIRESRKRKIPIKIISSNQNELNFNELKTIFGNLAPDYIFKSKPYKWPNDVYLRFLIWLVRSLGNYYLYFKKEFKNKNKGEIYFIIHGDTITAVIGALVAKACGVKLAHIESGLRSFSLLEPFPEEFNRLIISLLTDIHFCPNKWAVNNLKYRFGIKVNTFANTLSESTAAALKVRRKKVLPRLSKKYFVFVIHRQEHTLFNKASTAEIIRLITAHATSKLKCVFIMHHLTKDYLQKDRALYVELKTNQNVIMPKRLGYLNFVNLVNDAQFIATDGGSNQEEAYYLGKPCLILRNRTERTEGLGENAVLAKNNLKVVSDFIKKYKNFQIKKPLIKNKPSSLVVDRLVS